MATNDAMVQSADFLHISKERAFVEIAYAYGYLRDIRHTEYGTFLFEVERFGLIAEIMSHEEEAAQRLQDLRGSD